jgi:pimeloyl-ACP methyl ester carboxylesterase
VLVERLVFVHGSVRNGNAAWAAQRELSDRYELLVLNRPGYPPNRPEERIDFEEQGSWVGGLLAPGDHLCGHSYGGVVSLYAAGLFPELASLTVLEPPAFGLAAGDPAADELAERLTAHWEHGPEDPRDFLLGFYAAVAGREVELPDPLTPELEQGARALAVERYPWEADPPLDALAAARYPKLVVSGGWSRGFDAVCDVLEERLGAERAVLSGAGHNPQNAGGFNECLVDFLTSSGARSRR